MANFQQFHKKCSPVLFLSLRIWNSIGGAWFPQKRKAIETHFQEIFRLPGNRGLWISLNLISTYTRTSVSENLFSRVRQQFLQLLANPWYHSTSVPLPMGWSCAAKTSHPGGKKLFLFILKKNYWKCFFTNGFVMNHFRILFCYKSGWHEGLR